MIYNLKSSKKNNKITDEYYRVSLIIIPSCLLAPI